MSTKTFVTIAILYRVKWIVDDIHVLLFQIKFRPVAKLRDAECDNTNYRSNRSQKNYECVATSSVFIRFRS